MSGKNSWRLGVAAVALAAVFGLLSPKTTSTPSALPAPVIPSPPDVDSPKPVRRIVAGALCYWLGGLLFLGWTFYYTDWLPGIVSLLGLGGVLAWLPFVANVLNDETKQYARNVVETRVLASRAAPAFLLIVVALLLSSSLWGTVQIESLQRDVVVTFLRPGGKAVGGPMIVRGGTKAKFRLPLWRGGAYRVKVRGLPAVQFAATTWQRRELRVPDDFYQRSILLITPTAKLANSVLNGYGPFFVHVKAGSYDCRRPFSGRALWIGADADTDVPPHVVDGWRAALAQKGLDSSMSAAWLPPEAGDADAVLAAGEPLNVSIEFADSSPYYTAAPRRVLPLRSIREFPQEVQIDAP